MITSWMMAAALAGAPKTLTLLQEERTVVAPAPVDALVSHAVCVRYRDSGAAELYGCSAADPLFAASREGLATSLPLPGSAHDVTGLVLGGAPGAGGWVALDAHLAAVWRFGRASVSSLDEATVGGLASWCSAATDDGLVVELTSGCARRVDLGRAPAGGLVKVKDLADRFVGSETGAFVTEGAKAATCEGEPQVVLVKAMSKASICTGEVWPAALEFSRQQLATFKASPDAVDAPVRALFGDLTHARVSLDDLAVRLGVADAQLAQASVDLAAVRQAVEGVDGSDARFISLLTKLDSIDAHAAESVVASGSIQERRAALGSEQSALGEKAAEPGLDGMLVSRLGGALHDLVTRIGDLRDETARLEAAVSEVRQGIGYLQGGLLSVEKPAGPAPKGR